MLAAMSNEPNTYTIEIGELKLSVAGNEHGIHVGEAGHELQVADRSRLRSFTGTLPDGSEIPIYVEEGEKEHEYIVYLRGEVVPLTLVTHRDERLRALRSNTVAAASSGLMLTAPMPGLLKSILVQEGSVVQKGESLCILEAMKMENEIKSPDRLQVKRLIAQPGNAVEKGAKIMELESVK